MRASRRTIVRLAPLFLLISLSFGALAPARAATTTGLQVQTDSAAVDFPKSLVFHLIADVDQPVVSVETWYHPAFSPVTSVVRADFKSDSHVDVSNTVDMQLNYLPPGIDIIYRWRLTLRDGSVVETPEKTVLYTDTRFKWQTKTEGTVTVYYYAGDDQIGQAALDQTVKAIDNMRKTFKLTADEPVRVVIYSSTRDFASALPPNSAEWIGGFTQPGLHLVVTGVDKNSDPLSEIERILSHEAVHLIVHQATENPFNEPPPWLDEGLATYYQAIADPRFGPVLQHAINSGTLTPIKALNSTFPDDPNQALLSYAESESIVNFIVHTKGNDGMSALLQAYQGGVSNEQAVQTAFGESIDQLDKEWKKSLNYPGDKGISASIDSRQDGGGSLNDSIGPFGTPLLLGLAALFALGSGLFFTIRARKLHDDQPIL
jgi:peptidase MA superfamily protein